MKMMHTFFLSLGTLTDLLLVEFSFSFLLQCCAGLPHFVLCKSIPLTCWRSISLLSKNFKKPLLQASLAWQKKLSPLFFFFRVVSCSWSFFCRLVVIVPSFSHVWEDGKSVLRVITHTHIFKSAEKGVFASSSWIIIIIIRWWWKWWWANTTTNKFRLRLLKPQSSNHFWTTTHQKSWEDHPQK